MLASRKYFDPSFIKYRGLLKFGAPSGYFLIFLFMFMVNELTRMQQWVSILFAATYLHFWLFPFCELPVSSASYLALAQNPNSFSRILSMEIWHSQESKTFESMCSSILQVCFGDFETGGFGNFVKL